MNLLKPMHIWTSSFPGNGDQSMDVNMNMFTQLSEAGIIVGSRIEVSDVNVDILLQNTINEQIVRKFAENFGYAEMKQSTAALEHLFENVKMLINVVQENHQFISTDKVTNGPENNLYIENGVQRDEQDTNNVDTILIDMIAKTVIDCIRYQSEDGIINGQEMQINAAANPLLYEIIGQALMKNIKTYVQQSDSLDEIYICIDAIDKLFTSPETMLQIKNNVKLAAQSQQTNKVELIKAMIKKETHTKNKIDILENIRSIMQNEALDELFESAINLSYCEESLIRNIITEMEKHSEDIVNESVIAEVLRKCIVSAVKISTNDDIKQIAETPGKYSPETLNTYLTDTISLARALGFTDCILNLSNIINSNGDIIAQLKEDEKSFELLQRVIVMNKLSQNNEVQKKSLDLLRYDPYSARNDIVLRELLRFSGICTINLVEGNKLTDSNDVPISLIYSGNQLAIEDFLMRKQSKPRGPILIVKDRFQAVVPRESSRDVLTGKCAYTVLDENGIRHFEPLHMFAALKLKNVTLFEDRFSSYSAENAKNHEGSECDNDIDNILNMGTITTAYKPTSWLKKDFENIYINRRHPSIHGMCFDRSQVNCRRSYYL